MWILAPALLLLAEVAAPTDRAPPGDGPPVRVQIVADGWGDALRIELRTESRAVRCAEAVRPGHPCVIAAAPVGWQDLSVAGSSRFAQPIELLPGSNMVRVVHKSYGRALGGTLVAVAGVGLIALGGSGSRSNVAEDSGPRVSISIGAIALTIGMTLILHDLMRSHDCAEVSQP